MWYRFVIFLVCLFATGLRAQAFDAGSHRHSRPVYRCIQANGAVRYTTTPAPGCVVLFVYDSKKQSITTSSRPSARPAQAHDDRLLTSGSYSNRESNTVHRPSRTESGLPPTGATARCRDGTYSFSQSRRGTCSHHGGVGTWLSEP